MRIVLGAMLGVWAALIVVCMALVVALKPRCPACGRKTLKLLSRPVSWVGFVDGNAVVRCRSCGAKSECDMAGRWTIVEAAEPGAAPDRPRD
jgi:hypothetical protein